MTLLHLRIDGCSVSYGIIALIPRVEHSNHGTALLLKNNQYDLGTTDLTGSSVLIHRATEAIEAAPGSVSVHVLSNAVFGIPVSR
ncbi:hypothetical protein ABH922_005577 [Rhodococcus sp. 27YEA15]|uniref:hypothetical protein n=1 Tax=Rhodococcus sp. 27YEA15 TaxID=3156259 RepID=UPI003C7A58BC